MLGSNFVHKYRAWISRARMSAACAVMAAAVMPGAPIQAQTVLFAIDCALKETLVITLIEDHGAAQDLPSDRLGEAGLTMLRARSACYQGRVGEALSLYDSILSLGPVASLRGP
jgi:hypothetical protein